MGLEVERLYTCIICGRAWASKQALRGHMKAHKGEWFRTSIYVRRDPWQRFDELCRDHKTTTCNVVNVLVEGLLKGMEVGSIDLARIVSPNPVVINLSQVFLGKPRSAWKTEVLRGLPWRPACPRCGSGEVRVIHPEGLEYSEGRCLRCRAEFLVTVEPGRKPRKV